MSIWTHVNAAFRIDTFLSEIDFEKVFGKELDYWDDYQIWDEAEKNPNEFLPLGSEGSLKMHVWENPDKNCMARYTVSIFGDLRDVEDIEKVAWELMVKLDSADLMVRQAFVSATNFTDELHAVRNNAGEWELYGFKTEN